MPTTTPNAAPSRGPITLIDPANQTLLPRDSNQALGIGTFAVDFMARGSAGKPAASVLERTALFHTDAVLCGLSAIALGTNAPAVLRDEAIEYTKQGSNATIFGSHVHVAPEKAIVANSAAVREWDSNGTNFGFNPALGHVAGEFGHNDFYPVAIAAAQRAGKDGAFALRGMVLIDEIRGRLAEVFSLKSYKIDHVVHGAIGSAAAYGAMLGASPEQIESAIGMLVAHYIPWRAIRAGKQLSDSKGASAAISTEAAILCMQRSMKNFRGPRDIFRNPEAIFRFFEPTTKGKDRWVEVAPSPFDLVLSHSGDDFAVMGMHFKLGLYEHQSAGALQGAIDLIAKHPELLDDSSGGAIQDIRIIAYEPAFGIIGNPAKMDPKTRQSADHSMAYIVATLLRKALEYCEMHGKLPTAPVIPPPPSEGGGQGVGGTATSRASAEASIAGPTHPPTPSLAGRGGQSSDHHIGRGGTNDAIWKALMLLPDEYREDETAIFHPVTRAIMKKIRFEHGGPEYDAKYPDGIPTSVIITDNKGTKHDSGFVMYPAGHARNTTANLQDILATKFERLGAITLQDPRPVIERFNNLAQLSAKELASLHDFEITMHGGFA
jgi:2-methylcitrate dehydratase